MLIRVEEERNKRDGSGGQDEINVLINEIEAVKHRDGLALNQWLDPENDVLAFLE